MTDLDALERAARAATPGEWILCQHLLDHDQCSCGYRGGIFGPDGEYMICEMGSTVVEGEEGLEAPRYERSVEIANAEFMVTATPSVVLAFVAAHRALQERVDGAEKDEWQPIETAPSGTEVLLCAMPTWYRDETSYGVGTVEIWAEGAGSDWQWAFSPTHWRPLPEPPARTKAGEPHEQE